MTHSRSVVRVARKALTLPSSPFPESYPIAYFPLTVACLATKD